jgi:predicted AlkP superfamily phosphohydrolase/phosphomutase
VGLGGIYVNRKGREAKGTVDPGEEARGLRQEIANKLSQLRDDARGEVAIERVEISAKIYRGPYLDAGPDLLIGYNRGYRASWGAAVGAVSQEVFEDNEKAWGGDHCIDPDLVPGVLFCNRPLNDDAPGLEDMAPTALTLFGVPVPRHMEGQALL